MNDRCPVCGSKGGSHPHPLYKICGDCEAIFQYKNITQIDDYYADCPLDYTFQIGSYRKYIDIIKETIRLDDVSILVDVGAGDGTFLKEFSKQVPLFKLYAVEDSVIASERLLEREIEVIEVGDLEAYNPKLITSFQVLEHVTDAVQFFQKMGMKPGDYLVLTSPAVDAIYQKIYGSRWRSLSPSHHVILYGRKALNVLAEKLGLQVLQYRYCVSGCNSLGDSLVKYLFSVIKWPVKLIIGRREPFPLFHGKNSFIAILYKSA